MVMLEALQEPFADTADGSPFELEKAFWKMTEDSPKADAYETYLHFYPEGTFAPLARRRVPQPVAAAPTVRQPPAPDYGLAGLDFDRLDERAKANTARLTQNARKASR